MFISACDDKALAFSYIMTVSARDNFGNRGIMMSCNISVAKTKCCSSLLCLGLSIESISTFHVLVQKIRKLHVGMFQREAS